MKVSIIGIEKAAVLFELYNHARYAGKDFEGHIMQKIGTFPAPGKQDIAIETIKRCEKSGNFYFGYINLGAGDKPLRVDLSGEEFDSTAYDNMHGYEGYAEKIVAQLRAKYNKAYDESTEQLLAMMRHSFLTTLATENVQNSASNENSPNEREEECLIM